MIRRMSAFALLALALVSAVLAPGIGRAAPAASQQYDLYTLPGSNVFPEGVAYQNGTGNFYVSSTSDGAIFRGNIREPAAEVFLPGGQDGRTAAAGLKVFDDRLFVSGANTGKAFIYDTNTGALIAGFDNDLAGTFINDVTVAKDGTAYFTDSVAPYLYKATPTADGGYTFETWLDFTGTAFVYGPGFNANGIAISQNQRYLVIVQSSTGKLFRVDTATKEVSQIDLGGATVSNGDGILLLGRFLYVVQNRQELITKIQLNGDLSSGEVLSRTTDPLFAFPTTIARAQDRLLVVNSQFDKRGPGLTPDEPFTVASVPIP